MSNIPTIDAPDLREALKARLRKAMGQGWHPYALEAAAIAEDAIAALSRNEEAGEACATCGPNSVFGKHVLDSSGVSICGATPPSDHIASARLSDSQRERAAQILRNARDEYRTRFPDGHVFSPNDQWAYALIAVENAFAEAKSTDHIASPEGDGETTDCPNCTGDDAAYTGADCPLCDGAREIPRPAKKIGYSGWGANPVYEATPSPAQPDASPSGELLPATQADRDGAANWHQAQGNWIVDYDAMRRGEMDASGTVQAFIRERLRRPSLPQQSGELREAALVKAAGIARAFAEGQQRMIDEEGPSVDCEAGRDTALAIERCIMRLASATPPQSREAERAELQAAGRVNYLLQTSMQVMATALRQIVEETKYVENSYARAANKLARQALASTEARVSKSK